MTSRPRALPLLRHVLAAPLAAAMLLAVAACGSDDTSAEPAPQSGSPTTASSSPTPTPTASETPTTTPLSPYEDNPAVKVLRNWAYLLGKAVPARDAQLRRLNGVLQGQAMTSMRDAVDSDLGNEWPGPLPFTPVRVDVTGKRAKIDICFQTHGWSLDPKTHAPVEPDRKVIPAQMWLTKASGRWVIDGYYTSTITCSEVPVKGVAW